MASLNLPNHVNRRSFLVGALAIPIMAVGRQPSARSIPTTPALSLDASTLYRPQAITSPTDLALAPRDARYVTWRWARSSGMMLQEAFQTLGPNDILVLPEDSRPYEIDSSRGFVSGDGVRDRAMARAKRGLVGMGPGAVVQPSQSAYWQGPSTSTSGNQNKVLECWTTGAFFGNFEMRGRDFGGVGYDALRHVGADSVWERIFCNGAHRGWRNSPPGETGGLVGVSGPRQKILNCEIDCRDPITGTRVGSSPYMFNNQSDVLVRDVYAHHSVAGMPTFWRVTNATVQRLISEHNGSGSGTLSGSAHNFELCKGNILLSNCTLVCDYRNPSNTGLHIATNSSESPATFSITNPSFDAGPYGGVFSIAIWSDYGGARQTQHAGLVTVLNQAGQPIPKRATNFNT